MRDFYFLNKQAIIESDPFSITLKDLSKARKLGKYFAKEIGCSDIDCLYTKVSETGFCTMYV